MKVETMRYVQIPLVRYSGRAAMSRFSQGACIVKTIVLCLALLAGCVTRTIVAAPTTPTAPQFHHAQDFVGKNHAWAGAKCETSISTAVYDEAQCDLPNGALLVAWHNTGAEGGYGFIVLNAPQPAQPHAQEPPPSAPPASAPPTAPAPPATPPHTAEAPKKK